MKAGDTAGKIAANEKSTSVSLDQMLVALLRSNPDAFIDGNINRIRAGAVVQIPGTEQALSVSASEATRVLATQSKNFNSYRSTLATNAPAAAVGAADRTASGKVQAKVEDKKPSAATPDKLTLSKGGVQAKEAESRIARERADKEAAARAAEIAKNISDLKKASAAIAPASAPAATAAGAAASSPAAAAPGIPVVSAASAAAATAASAPAAAASAVPKPPPPAAPPIPAEEPGFLDGLLEDPLIPAAGAGLLALLGGGLLYYRKRQKKPSNQVDSSFIESRLQPDSFFGASGGQRVDTSSDGPASGSSMMYSASQLDAADDVDPVAEADVYMAYGRDLQAEEILKEALKTNSGRLAIHTKLLEIFAKRRDTRNFEASATQAFKLTGNNSPDWTRICELGLSIDPTNPLYQPGGTPANADGPAMASAAAASQFGATVAMSAHPEIAPAAPGAVDLDLDLDFSLDDAPPASAISDVTGSTLTPSAVEPTVKMEAPAAAIARAADDNSLDFELSGPGEPTAAPTPELPDLPDVPVSTDGVSMPATDGLDLPDLEPPAIQAPPPEPEKKDDGMLEFDMGSLSLDLDPPAPAPAPAPAAAVEPALLPDIDMPTQAPDSTGEDPLETKLALAEEFVSIGDEDGARALIEEVMAEATGEMRAKAQRALANLG